MQNRFFGLKWHSNLVTMKSVGSNNYIGNILQLWDCFFPRARCNFAIAPFNFIRFGFMSNSNSAWHFYSGQLINSVNRIGIQLRYESHIATEINKYNIINTRHCVAHTSKACVYIGFVFSQFHISIIHNNWYTIFRSVYVDINSKQLCN